MKRKDMLLSLREAAEYLEKTYGNTRLIIHRHQLKTVVPDGFDRRRRYISRSELSRYRRRRVTRIKQRNQGALVGEPARM